MEKNLEPYVKIVDSSKNTIEFLGDTEEEKRKNEMLFELTLELNRYQNMTQDILDYILKEQKDNKGCLKIYDIIKEYCG